MTLFAHTFLHYCYEVLPALAIGFFVSGIVHEMLPDDLVYTYLGRRGLIPIIAATLIGTILPVCCWGSLPIAVSFYKKGARLGPIFAFLVATPATSISALLVSYNVLGLFFAVYIFSAVIVMGVVMGLIGDAIPYHRHAPDGSHDAPSCPHCLRENTKSQPALRKTVGARIAAALRYAFIELPREIGLELVIGLILASAVAAITPLGRFIRTYLVGWRGYLFGITFGILTYFCSTVSVPFVDSLIRQGMNPGVGMTMLLIGPVTSYGTILVLRKEYGTRVTLVFLGALALLSLAFGLGFQIALRYITI